MRHGYKSIALDLVDIPEGRVRGEKPARVETLAKDMAASGLLQPIIVIEQQDGRFTLVKGLQRLAAAKRNKWHEIDARVTPAQWIKDQESRLHDLMATLNRESYTKLERAEALAELKIVYEVLYPEARKGGDKRSQAAKNKDKNQSEIFSFRSEAAEAAGLSMRAIELAVAIANGLSDLAKSRIRGTWLEDHQASLKALSEESPVIQEKALDLVLADEPQASSIADAIIMARGGKLAAPTEKAFQTVLDKWSRFEIRQKRNFVRVNRDELSRLLSEEGVL